MSEAGKLFRCLICFEPFVGEERGSCPTCKEEQRTAPGWLQYYLRSLEIQRLCRETAPPEEKAS